MLLDRLVDLLLLGAVALRDGDGVARHREAIATSSSIAAWAADASGAPSSTILSSSLTACSDAVERLLAVLVVEEEAVDPVLRVECVVEAVDRLLDPLGHLVAACREQRGEVVAHALDQRVVCRAGRGDRRSEQFFDLVLAGTLVGVTDCDTIAGGVELDRPVALPEVGSLVEVVEQVGVERVVVGDQHRALEQGAALDIDRVGQPDDDLLVTFELGVVERLDREEQFGRPAVGERQRAAAWA